MGLLSPAPKHLFPSPCPCPLFIFLREQLSVLSLWIFQASPLHLINWTNSSLSLSPSPLSFCCNSELKDFSFLQQAARPVSITHRIFFPQTDAFLSPSKGHFGWGFQNAGEGFSVCAELPAKLPRPGCFSDRGDKGPQGLLSSVDSLFSFCLLRGNSLRGYWRENICGR